MCLFWSILQRHTWWNKWMVIRFRYFLIIIHFIWTKQWTTESQILRNKIFCCCKASTPFVQHFVLYSVSFRALFCSNILYLFFIFWSKSCVESWRQRTEAKYVNRLCYTDCNDRQLVCLTWPFDGLLSEIFWENFY